MHESTRSTPDNLFLRRGLKCPLGVQWDLSPVSDGNNNTNKFWTQAYRNLLAARKRVAQRFNANRKPHQYKVGDLVHYQLKLSSSKSQEISAKLLLRWSEPVTIAKMLRPNVVLLANPDTGVIIRRAHVSQFKPCPK